MTTLEGPVPIPQPGRFLFGGLIYSAEDHTVPICRLDGSPVGTIQLGQDVPLHMMFRRHEERDYAWAVCRTGARLFDVTNPAAPSESMAFRPTPGWTFMGAALDQETGRVAVVESRNTGQPYDERRLVTWNVYDPQAPRWDGMAPLGTSTSDRGGLVEMLGVINGRRLCAATYSATSTAIVDITGPPARVSTSLPCLQAMASRGAQLYGTDGDNIMDARSRIRPTHAVEMASRWNTWVDLGTAAPRRIAYLECPGFVYDQDPNLRRLTRDGATYLMSGWTDGYDAEFVSVLSVGINGDLAEIKRLQLPLGIVPALIDLMPGGGTAWVKGWTPFTLPDGWRYYAVPILGLPTTARLGDPVELHP